jgi:broad specificity phosphatase PhoE
MIRFHFIRHAETYANRDGIVLGQTESTLTWEGKRKSEATGTVLERENRVRGIRYWRVYTSDLQRCKDTAKLIMSNYKAEDTMNVCCEDNNVVEDEMRIVVDSRLRERAKGVREGRPKWLSQSQCLELHHKDEKAAGKSLIIPLLESEGDVYYRLGEFLTSVMRDVLNHQHDRHIPTPHQPSYPSKLSKDYHVLVVSHSGTIRTLISRILGGENWVGSHSFLSVDPDIKVPNLSITSIDTVPTTTSGILIQSSKINNHQHVTWNVVALQLPSVKHLVMDNHL